jgi:FkbM family methyltransferase
VKDVLGNILRITPHFRGKSRLRRLWENTIPHGLRQAVLPDGSVVSVDMEIPYERMVWLQSEEWDELRYLRTKLRPGDSFVDVGANIGLWTLVAASTVGAEGQVFCFEPNPVTFRKLIANITRNARSDIVTAFPNVVSREEGVVSFSCPPHHNLSAITSGPESDDTLQVRTVSLDSKFSAEKIAGIKLDTEGHELESLGGASRLIQNVSPWFIIEFNTTLLTSPTLGDWQVYRFLSSRGYTPFVYEGSIGQEMRIDEMFKSDGYCNILFQRVS